MPHRGSDDATISLVRSDGCHYCEDAITALADLAARYPVQVSIVDADSAMGAVLLAEHRPTMFPLVLVDGRMFSYGRLPRRKLAAFLQTRTRAGVW